MTVLFYQREIRTVTKRRIYAVFSFCISMLAATILPGQQALNRSLVTSSQVLAVMRDQGLPIVGVDVRIASPVTASVADAQLDLRSGSMLSSREIRLRIGCHVHAQCLPFFVTATWPEAIDVNTLPVKMERGLFSTSSKNASNSLSRAAKETPVQKIAFAKAEPEQAPKAKVVEAALITSPSLHPDGEGRVSDESRIKTAHDSAPHVASLRSGSAATLDIEEDKIHIRVAVISLQDGAIGDKVRVTSRDHKQVYLAEIVAPTLLKGTLR